MLRRVEAGETLTVTVADREVAELSPDRKRRWVSGSAQDRIWQGPAPRNLDRAIATMGAALF